MKIFRLVRKYVEQKMHPYAETFMKQKKKSYIEVILFFEIMFLVVSVSCIYGSNEQHSLYYETYQFGDDTVFLGYIFIIFSIIFIPIGLIYMVSESKEKEVKYETTREILGKRYVNEHEELTKRLDEHIKWMKEIQKKSEAEKNLVM